MQLLDEIMAIQSELNIPDYILCNALSITLSQLRAFRAGRFKPDTYSLIMFIDAYERPLHSIN